MKKIIIYSTKTCPYCVLAKDYLTEKGFAYEIKDVSEDEAAKQEFLQKSGGRLSVPLIDIDNTIIIGFDKSKVDAALGI